MSKDEIKTAAGKCWQVISRSDSLSHVEPLADGWAVKAERIYKRSGRIAWSPWYSLITPSGKPLIAGYKSAGAFVNQAMRFFE